MANPVAIETSSRGAVNPAWLNRRVYLRHLGSPVTSGQVASCGFRYRRARIQDLSLGGVALQVRRPVPVGALVRIQLRNEILDIAYDLSGRVAHARQHGRDLWVIGCAFDRELTPPELESLL